MTKVRSSGSVLITGASSGIGKACALYLADLGFTTFAGVRREGDAAALKQEVSSNLTPIFLDVTDSSMIEAARDKITNEIGNAGLVGLVNNAGIPLGGPLEFAPLSDIRHEMEVNLLGAVAVTQAFLALIRRGQGRIVNISSLSGFIALPFLGPYAMTKFGMRAFTDSLRRELRPWSISVSVLEVGDVDTRIWDKSLAVIEKTAQEMPDRGMELYGPVVGIKERFQPHGIPPLEVAMVAHHALFSKRPKARYVVGRDAKLLDLMRHLPTPILDWVISKQLPEYGHITG
jgi:NAD(P)-dependent dehydrogenase (short-subunit alcohol dehydrogenase family)